VGKGFGHSVAEIEGDQSGAHPPGMDSIANESVRTSASALVHRDNESRTSVLDAFAKARPASRPHARYRTHMRESGGEVGCHTGAMVSAMTESGNTVPSGTKRRAWR
jgi:hypothetical protein